MGLRLAPAPKADLLLTPAEATARGCALRHLLSPSTCQGEGRARRTRASSPRESELCHPAAPGVRASARLFVPGPSCPCAGESPCQCVRRTPAAGFSPRIGGRGCPRREGGRVPRCHVTERGHSLACWRGVRASASYGPWRAGGGSGGQHLTARRAELSAGRTAPLPRCALKLQLMAQELFVPLPGLAGDSNAARVLLIPQERGHCSREGHTQ